MIVQLGEEIIFKKNNKARRFFLIKFRKNRSVFLKLCVINSDDVQVWFENKNLIIAELE